jgi:hypothetical protein
MQPANISDHYSGSDRDLRRRRTRRETRGVVDSAVRMDHVMARKKTKRKKASGSRKGKAVKKKVEKKVAKQKRGKKRTAPKALRKKRIRGRAGTVGLVTYETRGLGPRSGGQSGDTQGLSGVAETSAESVEELLEEGQTFEAEVLQGVEGVPDADESEVHTREVPADDVPEEYRERD